MNKKTNVYTTHHYTMFHGYCDYVRVIFLVLAETIYITFHFVSVSINTAELLQGLLFENIN